MRPRASNLIQDGIDFANSGDHEKALHSFSEVLSTDSEALDFHTAIALFFKACILEKMGKTDGMNACYLKIIEMELEEQDVETIVYVYEKSLKQNTPDQMHVLSSDIPVREPIEVI